jgi:hypothetical protein
VLRLQSSGVCDLKPDRCVASDQIDSYPEPDGRSGISSPSAIFPKNPSKLIYLLHWAQGQFLEINDGSN